MCISGKREVVGLVGRWIMCFGVRMEEGENKKTWRTTTTQQKSRREYFLHTSAKRRTSK